MTRVTQIWGQDFLETDRSGAAVLKVYAGALSHPVTRSPLSLRARRAERGDSAGKPPSPLSHDYWHLLLHRSLVTQS
mgnify:CR=1 FL=1